MLNENENATPVTEDEVDDIRVTLELDDGVCECEILTIFECGGRDYIALMPLDEDGDENAEGDVYLYRYHEDAEGIPDVEFIDDDAEYARASARFEELIGEDDE